jgi:hypothetical protein
MEGCFGTKLSEIMIAQINQYSKVYNILPPGRRPVLEAFESIKFPFA